MKKSLKKFKATYYALKKVRLFNFYWRFRHLINRNWPKNYLTPSCIDHPHRKLLIETILKYRPMEDVLEIGCASGPNLFLLNNALKGTRIHGIDISGSAISYARKWFNARGVEGVDFTRLKIEELNKIADKSMDLVFTDASLIYVSSKSIEKVLKDMTRIAKKAIVLNELDGSDEREDDYWLHDYKKLFQKLNLKNILFTKISKNAWGGCWGEKGYIIEVIL